MRPPQIQEVVARVGEAADNWHMDMPPGGVGNWEDAAEEDLDELEHGEFSLFPVRPSFFRPPVQLGYSRPMRATGRLLTWVLVLCSPTMYTRPWLDKMGWKPTRSLQNPCTNARIRITVCHLVAFLHGDARDTGPSSRRCLGANRSAEHFPHYLRCGTRAACPLCYFTVILGSVFLVCLVVTIKRENHQAKPE